MQKLFLVGLFLSVLLTVRAAQDAPTTTPPASPDAAKSQTADGAWAQIDALKSSFMDAAQNGDPSAKSLVPQMQSALNAFSAKYPKDEHSWAAQIMLGQLDVIARKMGLPNAPPAEKVTQRFEAIAADKTAPKQARAQASMEVITELFPSQMSDPVNWDTLDAKIDAFGKEFGDFSPDGEHPLILVLREQELELLKMSNNEPRYLALVKKLSADPNPEMATLAKQEMAEHERIAELKTKPLDLKFTAVDGMKIDFAQLRGKVVLLDFWATWCGPCVQEMPEVVATYQKYHAQGFTIVGISLDQDKDALLSFTKQNGMVWPQFFDGQGFDNAISHSYGISSIPTMWLFDQKGMLVNANAGADLDGEVSKLLKSP